jgi:hypothetical protein
VDTRIYSDDGEGFTISCSIVVQGRPRETPEKVGTFIIRDDTRKTVSPVFPDLYFLYRWMALNGWHTAPYDGEAPWGVVRTFSGPVEKENDLCHSGAD